MTMIELKSFKLEGKNSTKILMGASFMLINYWTVMWKMLDKENKYRKIQKVVRWIHSEAKNDHFNISNK